MSATTMTCLCDRTHEFAEGVFEQTCPCGFVLVLTETVTEGGDEKPARPTAKLAPHSILRPTLEHLARTEAWLPVGTIPHNVAVADMLLADGLIETRGEGRDRYARATDAGRAAV